MIKIPEKSLRIFPLRPLAVSPPVHSRRLALFNR